MKERYTNELADKPSAIAALTFFHLAFTKHMTPPDHTGELPNGSHTPNLVANALALTPRSINELCGILMDATINPNQKRWQEIYVAYFPKNTFIYNNLPLKLEECERYDLRFKQHYNLACQLMTDPLSLTEYRIIPSRGLLGDERFMFLFIKESPERLFSANVSAAIRNHSTLVLDALTTIRRNEEKKWITSNWSKRKTPLDVKRQNQELFPCERSCIPFIGDRLKKDPEFMEKLIKICGEYIHCAHKELKLKNQALVILALTHSPSTVFQSRSFPESTQEMIQSWKKNEEVRRLAIENKACGFESYYQPPRLEVLRDDKNTWTPRFTRKPVTDGYCADTGIASAPRAN